MDKETNNHELDLPLSANIRDVDITHFLLHLTCNLEQKVLSGNITLFCYPTKGGNFFTEPRHMVKPIDYKTSSCEKKEPNVKAADKQKNQCVLGDSGEKMIDDFVGSVYESHDVASLSCNNARNKNTTYTSLTVDDTSVLNDTEKSDTSNNILIALNTAASATSNEIQYVSESLEATDSQSQTFSRPVIILDSHALDVNCVEEVMLSQEMEQKLLQATKMDIESRTGVYMQCYMEKKTRPLAFSVGEHSLKIWTNPVYSRTERTSTENEASFVACEVSELVEDEKSTHLMKANHRINMELESENGEPMSNPGHCNISRNNCLDSENVRDFRQENHTSNKDEKKDDVCGNTAEKDDTFEMGRTCDTVGETFMKGETNEKKAKEIWKENSETCKMVGETYQKKTDTCEKKDEVFEKEDGMFEKCLIPRVVRIHYSTKPSGPSLKWTMDQDGRPCMFTVGHWLNNRTWFPSQDAPSAMPTWQAVITVPDHLTVLMSGDKSSQPTLSSGHVTFHYYTTMPMPTSTLAIAVGSWRQIDVIPETEENSHRSASSCVKHGSSCIVNYAPKSELPCRVFAADSLVSVVEKELAVYIPRCLHEVYGILGQHPFQRLDVLIVPSCFDSLGMASPSLLLLSQSLLVGNSSMCARVAHEICHSWFGLLIGPQDWTEEWLTEGFCTYLEDILHARVCQWTDEEVSDHLELRVLLKQKTLMSELENTEEDLQKLRPNQGEQLRMECDSVQYVKNGMNPEKAFMQVHYLKGFFLLRHLQNMVGLTQFLHFLHQYVVHYHGQLVTSQDFFSFFFETFPLLRHEGMDEKQLISEWLDCAGLPQAVKLFTPRSLNRLWNVVKSQVSVIEIYCKKKNVKKRQRLDIAGLMLHELDPDQLVVFLEELLDLDHIPAGVLDLLLQTYNLSGANPEIRHRWCELVVKHQYKTGYKDIKQFLVHDQAMGVYLYGEMMLSGCRKLKELARQCFDITKEDMPPGAYGTVHSMLYGT